MREAPIASIEAGASSSEGDLLEAKLFWGKDAMGVRHVAARGEVRVCDLGFDVVDADTVVAGRDEGGVFGLRLPNGASVPAGCRMALRIGRMTLRLSLVADDAVKLPRALPDGRAAFGILAAAALHLVVLGLVADGRPDQGHAEEEARQTMMRMVSAAEDRALTELTAAREKTRAESAGAPARAAEQAAAGNPSKTQELVARARVTRGEDHHAAKADRESVSTFGILSILQGDGAHAGSSAFAAESGPAAMGNIFGQTIDDAAGLGGLGLTGPGQGGGGLGAGIELAAIGTGNGFGQCHCRLGGSHATRAPTLRVGESQVNGRLPPEAIQRVVRAGFGRLRGCYERALQRSPELEGRITVKFVIDRDGNVALASAADRTLDDAAVASCVVKAYEAMSFPKPEGGIVTVIYPVVFTSTSP